VVSKCGDQMSASATHTHASIATNNSAIGQISAGKLAGNKDT